MATSSGIDPKDLTSFHEHLLKSKRVLALCGAGLSAASGLPTFRGAGGLWRTHKSTDLATPGAWRRDSGLVWQFYNYRRHVALQVQPNAAHYALAQLAKTNPNFQCLSQNVDGLCERADHPRSQLQLLHGTLFKIKCDDETGLCNYMREDFTDPVCPALAVPTSGQDPSTNAAVEERKKDIDISDAAVKLSSVPRSALPQCPQCKSGVLRPGVVWFGEPLPPRTLELVEDWVDAEPVDLIMVIGTSAQVYPAAGYVDSSRSSATRVAVINMDTSDIPGHGLSEQDWFFQGDAAKIVPELLRPVIGNLSHSHQT